MPGRGLRRMSMFACCLVIVTAAAAMKGVAQAPRAGLQAKPTFAEPAISPDGSEIAFVSGGDIWIVPAAGGAAHLLVSHPATESRPIYSPDGKRLAFVSTRTGNGDIYVLTIDTADLKRLTFDDAEEQLDGWSKDGRWIYFSSAGRDIAGMTDIYRVSSEGGTPMPVSADRYVAEFFSAPSPDGTMLAITARGMGGRQWWRKGHSHIDEAEIWIRREAAPATYERVTEGSAKEMWPMWAPDSRTLFYVSDRGGAENVWTRAIIGQPRQVTAFKDRRVLWPTISADGRTIVFERDFQIWKLDAASGRAAAVPITRRGVPAGPAVDHLTLTSQIQELALSPDGKKVAFIVHGEVFAASAKDGGDAARVTDTPANESQLAWAPDSRRLAYASDRDGVTHLFFYDFKSNGETQLTRDASDDAWPSVSPDGKLLAFERNQRELGVIDLDSKQERVVAKGYLTDRLSGGRPIAWSPDSTWIAFLSVTGKGFRNVSVVQASGGEARPVSFLANGFGASISWSPDGTFILFNTGQRTEMGQLARIDLILRTPKFREDPFRDLFQEETPQPERPAPPPEKPREKPAPKPGMKAAPAAEAKSEAQKATGEEAKKPAAKPVEIVFENIRQRLNLVPVGVDVGEQVISPDGKWTVMTAAAAGQENLYVYSLDELARERPVARQLTSTPGAKADVQFSPDSKDVYYLDDGRIQTVSLERREPKPVGVTAELDVDFTKEKLEVFHQAWTYLRDEFFDAKFNGVDWDAVGATYAPHIAGARTTDEVRRLISLMVGELNASHLGISAPSGSTTTSSGRLGLRFDRAEYESAGRLRVTEVVPLGPCAVTRAIKAGDYLVAVDGTAIGTHTNLDELLDHTIGRRVALTIAASSDGKERREVAVRPVNQATEKGLIYREWVEANRAYVTKASGGRLGYVHMIDMSAQSLAQLYVDLDAENHGRDGVVVDIRNNNGGFVNVYAIDVLARRPYLTMTQRGLPPTPARTVLGQRALEAPTILVVNQHSLSDAEDFTEGYRALQLGKVVGEPTAGWIIYTWSARLIDGSNLRLPRTRITSSDGRDMEMHPRPVDVPVTRPIGESYTGRDSQLDTAVAELLKQVGTRTSTR